MESRSYLTFTYDELPDAAKRRALSMADFRNKFVAHQEAELTDEAKAEEGLKTWIAGLYRLHGTHQ